MELDIDFFEKKTILVVDDTPDNLSLMNRLLKADYRIKVANSGDKALDIVAESPPDLILLDIMMPGMDGYPHGLAGDAIPLSARLMAIADVHDALISRRVYKEGMSHEKAAAIIVEGRGNHFDPAMVDACVAIQDQFLEIAQRFADTDDDIEKKKIQLERLES